MAPTQATTAQLEAMRRAVEQFADAAASLTIGELGALARASVIVDPLGPLLNGAGQQAAGYFQQRAEAVTSALTLATAALPTVHATLAATVAAYEQHEASVRAAADATGAGMPVMTAAGR